MKKIPDTSALMTKTVLNTKISEVENKIPDNSKYITTEVNLVNKINFDNKLTSFDRRITSSKTKHLEGQKKLNSLITNSYIFFR